MAFAIGLIVYGLIPGKTQVLYSDFLSELDRFGGFLSSPVRRWFKTIGALPFMEPGSVVDVCPDDIVGNLPQEMNEF